MIVIGTDTHKRTHALAAVDNGTGRVRGHREIPADEDGHLVAMKWARGLDNERVWAIEDCRQVSRRLEQALIAAGERVVRVAPHRMGSSRRGERQPGKSDQIDSLYLNNAALARHQPPGWTRARLLDRRPRGCIGPTAALGPRRPRAELSGPPVAPGSTAQNSWLGKC